MIRTFPAAREYIPSRIGADCPALRHTPFDASLRPRDMQPLVRHGLCRQALRLGRVPGELLKRRLVELLELLELQH